MAVKIGDVFEIKDFPNTFLQYLGPTENGECSLIWKEDGKGNVSTDYVEILYPIGLNARKKNLLYVENREVLRQVPTFFKAPEMLNRAVVGWYILSANGDVRRVKALTDEEKKYPAGSLMSHIVLCEILSGVIWYSHPNGMFGKGLV